MADLAGLKSLESLNLGSTRITDAGLKHIAKLPRLQRIELRGTTISDSGLKELTHLPLEEMDLTGRAFLMRADTSGLRAVRWSA